MILALIGNIIFIILIIVLFYNSLAGNKNAVGNAFGSIDAMLKKRYDLLLNLVETVKQYMNFERDTLTKVTELHSKAVDPKLPPDQKIQLENQINTATRGIMVQVENYLDMGAGLIGRIEVQVNDDDL